MQKLSPWIKRNRTPAEDKLAIEEFLNKGGKVTKLNSDKGTYEKGLKKIEERLPGGFNPFSKEESLRID